MSRRNKRHRWPSRRPRVTVPPAAEAIVTQLAERIDEFTEQTRDPGWCHELAERLAPLVARTTSTDAVLDDVRAARDRHDPAGLGFTDRLLVLTGLVDQLADAYNQRNLHRAYSVFVAIAAVGVASAESIRFDHGQAPVLPATCGDAFAAARAAQLDRVLRVLDGLTDDERCDVCGRPAEISDGVVGARLCPSPECLAVAWPVQPGTESGAEVAR